MKWVIRIRTALSVGLVALGKSFGANGAMATERQVASTDQSSRFVASDGKGLHIRVKIGEQTVFAELPLGLALAYESY